MYEYLIGSLLCGVIWLFLFVLKKDLRKPMVWTAAVYILFSGIILSFWTLFRQFIYLGEPIVPSYWFPPTLFDIGRLTGFSGIGDILFLIFIAGIATALYEFIYKKEIIIRKNRKKHLRTFIIAFIAFFVFVYFSPYNLVYGFVFSNFVGAIVLCIERRDLLMHSLMGGVSFLIVYTIAFFVFIILFPDFILNFYNLNNLSGVFIFGIPLEEYLYAFSFGLMWAPMYEYEHGLKVR